MSCSLDDTEAGRGEPGAGAHSKEKPSDVFDKGFYCGGKGLRQSGYGRGEKLFSDWNRVLVARKWGGLNSKNKPCILLPRNRKGGGCTYQNTKLWNGGVGETGDDLTKEKVFGKQLFKKGSGQGSPREERGLPDASARKAFENLRCKPPARE